MAMIACPIESGLADGDRVRPLQCSPEHHAEARPVIRAKNGPSSWRIDTDSDILLGRVMCGYDSAPRFAAILRRDSGMPGYAIPQTRRPPKLTKGQVQLVANGDLR